MSNTGGEQNFEQVNVERPIFRNLKIASIKGYERSNYSIFSFFKNYLNTQIMVVFLFYFNAPIFYNFPNSIFF